MVIKQSINSSGKLLFGKLFSHSSRTQFPPPEIPTFGSVEVTGPRKQTDLVISFIIVSFELVHFSL